MYLEQQNTEMVVIGGRKWEIVGYKKKHPGGFVFMDKYGYGEKSFSYGMNIEDVYIFTPTLP